jgi:hypothetical protein
MESTLFTELINSEAISLVGGQSVATAFATFSARATGSDTAETDGNATTSATVNDDVASTPSSGFRVYPSRLVAR